MIQTRTVFDSISNNVMPVISMSHEKEMKNYVIISGRLFLLQIVI